ncbi:hypothetical protein [Pseudomonas gingeri]|uniref:Uncharacterized protein n=1 Tax=Pseudomonas gingeri TaxID=117681 RepID=A0A7Y8CKL6_9PSED|nr:hypothetical protein [Pseudomonas gingeri]NWA05448.1 hypothetical protein [Pseudomonas gingeri]NWA18093.1 hypothetical protein [Pseudomonas gingeri]NWA59057.1 hypothetical protein [Pseudomonas gingeri]NWA99619.1 hypothetical protein [Pseudomonas gingeri]NWB06174.1 hypothetical protein [Pseudomonas gingeri]
MSGKSLSKAFTAVMARDNQALPREMSVIRQENSMVIIVKAACTPVKYMVKIERRQKSWWQRSQGGV